MADETHLGWTNKETWLVNLWLSNEQGSYELARALCADCENENLAGDELERMVDEMHALEGFMADLINAALARVNWAEIARHMREA